MSQNTRLLLIALVILVVFGIFLQSLIASSLQESFGGGGADPKDFKLPNAQVPATPPSKSK